MNTTTLEQSKRLKELGAPQDTYLAWWKGKFGDWGIYIRNMYPMQPVEQIAAHTLEELIEWLGDDFSELVREVTGIGFIARGIFQGVNKKEVCNNSALEAVYNLAIAVKGENA